MSVYILYAWWISIYEQKVCCCSRIELMLPSLLDRVTTATLSIFGVYRKNTKSRRSTFSYNCCTVINLSRLTFSLQASLCSSHGWIVHKHLQENRTSWIKEIFRSLKNIKEKLLSCSNICKLYFLVLLPPFVAMQI